jgi:oligopeptide/dipeptide ABC transporter ATP-binding protein
VEFDIARHETVGLVGESGCGKTTLGRLVMGLVPATAGSVRLDGEELTGLSYRRLRPLRRKMQMVFQDPVGSLNPRSTVGRIVEEPLRVHGLGSAKERAARVRDLLVHVGLSPDAAARYPHEFSGGQRQRIGIARALALNPSLIIADEPVSALDVSVQAQVLNLLLSLQREFGLSFLFISHDLAVVRYIADRILVMYLGQIVEEASRADIWHNPLHPYTAGLLAAHPRPISKGQIGGHRFQPLEGDVPSPVAPPAGCRFHTRCPYRVERCSQEEPALRSFTGGRRAACHLVTLAADGTAISPTSAPTTSHSYSSGEQLP